MSESGNTDPSEPSATRPQPRLRIGEKTISQLIRGRTHFSVKMEENGADVDVRATALAEPDVSFLAESAVEAVLPDGAVTAMFTGLIETVELQDDVAHVVLVGLERELAEIRLGGLAHAGVRAVELIYSLLRLSGVPEDRMKLEGWTGSDPDVFIVAVPLLGVSVIESRSVLDVAFTPNNPARLLVPAGDLRERFTGATCWASTTVDAGSLFDAERSGLEMIDDALAALHALCSYSYSMLRDDLRPYRRARGRLMPHREGITFVGSVVAERQWLRATSDSIVRPVLDVDAESVELASWDPDQRLRRALREWRSAMTSDTPFATVTHLWRAVELYARGASADALFSKDEIRTVRDTLGTIQGLSAGQRKRVDELAARLNDAPLLARLRVALADDRVIVSAAEMDLLRATRDLRNDLEHAREITHVQSRVLAQAVGLVNRILVSAIAS